MRVCLCVEGKELPACPFLPSHSFFSPPLPHMSRSVDPDLRAVLRCLCKMVTVKRKFSSLNHPKHTLIHTYTYAYIYTQQLPIRIGLYGLNTTGLHRTPDHAKFGKRSFWSCGYNSLPAAAFSWGSLLLLSPPIYSCDDRMQTQREAGSA